MLVLAEINNFRSCEKVSLELNGPVVALVGKNGVGKTNILHAIKMTADLALGEGEGDRALAMRPWTLGKAVGLALTFRAGDPSRLFRYSYRGDGQLRDSYLEEQLECDGQVVFSRRGEQLQYWTSGASTSLAIGARAPSLKTLLQLLPSDDQLLLALQPAAESLRAVGYYPLLQGYAEHSSDKQHFIDLQTYDVWRSHLKQGAAQRSVQLRLLHMYLTQRSQFDELLSLLNDGLGLITDIKVDAVVPANPSETRVQAYAIRFMVGDAVAGSGRWFSYNGLSAGTWRVLQMLTYLVFEQNSCMLLEQPEDSVHAGLLEKVLDILKSYSDRTQLVCTTHSSRVIDLLEPNALRLVSAQNGATTVATLAPEDVAAAERYLMDHGTLTEFLESL